MMAIIWADLGAMAVILQNNTLFGLSFDKYIYKIAVKKCVAKLLIRCHCQILPLSNRVIVKHCHCQTMSLMIRCRSFVGLPLVIGNDLKHRLPLFYIG